MSEASAGFAAKPPVEPHPRFPELKTALQALEPSIGPWKGTTFRNSTAAHLLEYGTVNLEGSRYGGRWNPPNASAIGFGTLYSSLHPETATAEVTRNLSNYSASSRGQTRAMVEFAVDLDRVLDLTDAAVCAALGVKPRDLVETKWQTENDSGREALTQAIGRAAYSCKIQALIVPSAADPEGANLAIFVNHALLVKLFPIKSSTVLPLPAEGQ